MIRLVASALIIQENKVLLVREKSVDKYGIPGGKLEEGETLRKCVTRECREETGATIHLQRLVMMSEKPLTVENNTVLRFIYEATIEKGATDVRSGDLPYAFYTLEEVEAFAKRGELRGEDVLEMIRAYYAGTLTTLTEPVVFQ